MGAGQGVASEVQNNFHRVYSARSVTVRTLCQVWVFRVVLLTPTECVPWRGGGGLSAGPWSRTRRSRTRTKTKGKE